MTRGDVGLVLGLCGFLLGGFGAGLAYDARFRTRDLEAVSQHDGEQIEVLAAKVEEFRVDLQAANTRISALANELAELKEEWVKAEIALQARVTRIENRLPK